MINAFVFGKFLPFHKGHEAMINFAASKCDQLTVLVCCSDKEQTPTSVRTAWVEQTFAGRENIQVLLFQYREDELPNTSVSSLEVSRVWAATFKQLLPHHTLVVTSEPYGDFVADYMGIKHIPFDIPKQLVPVSATHIRNDLFRFWQYLPDSVKPYYAIKVVILGTESTGKTTMTEQLAAHFHCSKVLEAGGDLIDDSNNFTMNDLHNVVRVHAERIDNAVKGDSPLVIIDTDVHITISYCRSFFHQELPVSEPAARTNEAQLYLYLNNDVAHIQDGTRLEEDDRNMLDASHRQVLSDHSIQFVEVRGNWEQRFATAVHEIDKLIKSQKIMR